MHRIEVEQVRRYVWIDQRRIDRLRAGQVPQRNHAEIVDDTVAPAIDVTRILWILRLDLNAVGVAFDLEHPRMRADRSAQHRDGQAEIRTIVDKARFRAATRCQQDCADQCAKSPHPEPRWLASRMSRKRGHQFSDQDMRQSKI